MKIKNKLLLQLTAKIDFLKSVVENNEWHKNENVLDHTFCVVEHLDSLMLKLPQGIKQYFQTKIDKLNKKDVLISAVFLHDIGKGKTITTEKGKTRTLNHEKTGADMVSLLLKDILNISDAERKKIVKIIKYHGEIHFLLDKEHYSDFLLEKFKKKHEDIYWELIILGMADILAMGKCIKANSSNDYIFRLNFFKKEIVACTLK